MCIRDRDDRCVLAVVADDGVQDVVAGGGVHAADWLIQMCIRDSGATVVVIEHDLDVIRNADYIIDMGPGGGDAGGRIVACGTPEQICNDPASITGRYLRR